MDKLLKSCGSGRINFMKSYYQAVAVQATSILLAALGAALITFLQALLAQHSGGTIPPAPVEEAGVLGAVIKGSHLALKSTITKV